MSLIGSMHMIYQQPVGQNWHEVRGRDVNPQRGHIALPFSVPSRRAYMYIPVNKTSHFCPQRTHGSLPAPKLSF